MLFPEGNRRPDKAVIVVAGSYRGIPDKLVLLFFEFEAVPEKDEYCITHKKCGICKLTKQENCQEITTYLC